MTTLEDFLALPNVSEERHTIKIRGFEFIVKPMTTTQFGAYQRKAKSKTDKGYETDSGKLNLYILEGQIVEPNIRQVDFLSQVGCSTATEFLNKKFKAGEIAELVDQITQISGFDADFEDKVEEAKN